MITETTQSMARYIRDMIRGGGAEVNPQAVVFNYQQMLAEMGCSYPVTLPSPDQMYVQCELIIASAAWRS